jgi:hypothetical protein
MHTHTCTRLYTYTHVTRKHTHTTKCRAHRRTGGHDAELAACARAHDLDSYCAATDAAAANGGGIGNAGNFSFGVGFGGDADVFGASNNATAIRGADVIDNGNGIGSRVNNGQGGNLGSGGGGVGDGGSGCGGGGSGVSGSNSRFTNYTLSRAGPLAIAMRKLLVLPPILMKRLNFKLKTATATAAPPPVRGAAYLDTLFLGMQWAVI